eukprot:TRINITY_DN1312_c2_g1_i3.p2 TRINITY_DN1312_c2_g1~~TRINITY_DN1312_c2_g1_i3.p2  ORF type:complete len:106 (+),score=8.19 TRINITY_DN1312_c2_g1_i3:1238-1555(+)
MISASVFTVTFFLFLFCGAEYFKKKKKEEGTHNTHTHTHTGAGGPPATMLSPVFVTKNPTLSPSLRLSPSFSLLSFFFVLFLLKSPTRAPQEEKRKEKEDAIKKE